MYSKNVQQTPPKLAWLAVLEVAVQKLYMLYKTVHNSVQQMYSTCTVLYSVVSMAGTVLYSVVSLC